MPTKEKQKKTPQLRFPKFSGEWDISKVQDIFEITRGNVLAVSDMADEQTEKFKYPVYSSKTTKSGLTGYYNEYIYEDAITWTTDGANAGEVNFRDGKFYCTNVCGVLLSKGKYANQTVAQILNSITEKYVSYVGNPKLMNNVMAEIPIAIPPIEEQKKIAEFLSSADEWIENLEMRKQKLTEYKRGLMQKLFPAGGESVPELRFPEFSDKWEEVKFGEVGDLQNGYAFKSKNYSDQGIPIVRISNISNTHNGINTGDLKHHPEEDISDRYVVQNGDLLIAMSGATTGKVSVYDLSKIAYLNQRVGLFKTDKTRLQYDFLIQIAFSQIFPQQLNKVLVAGAQPNISSSDIESFKISLPSTEEQKKIADFLRSVDTMIGKKQEQIDAGKKWKRGLMQKMFV